MHSDDGSLGADAVGSRWTKLGLVAAIVLYLASALFGAITLPWKGSADAFAHMDYVYQVHQGQLPEAFGYKYRKVDLRQFNIGDPDRTHQWVASHPPLFYYIAASQMGKPLDSGKWEVAVKRGRFLNLMIGLCCVLALFWAGWTLGGERRRGMSVALAAIGGTIPIFNRLAGEIYNDLLVTLFSVVSIVLSILILKRGPRAGYLVAAVFACAAGMASKATFIFAFVIVLGSVFVATVSHGTGSLIKRALLGAMRSVLLGLMSLAPIAWFYQRNFEASGSWFLSTPEVQIQGRVKSTAWDVLSNDDFWLLVPRNLLGPAWDTTWPVNQTLSVWLFVLCALVLMFLFCRYVLSAPRKLFPAALVWPLLGWMLPVVHFAGLMFAQWHHATGYGALNIRYFAPGLLSMALLLTIPVIACRKISAGLVGIICSLLAFSGVMWMVTYLDRRFTALAEGQGSQERLLAAVEGNGLSADWVWVLLVIMLIGVLGVVLALARLEKAGKLRTTEILPHPPSA